MSDPTGPIDTFARDYVFSAARQGTLTQRQILDYQKASGDLNAVDTYGLSLLCSAAMNGHQTVVRRLIRNGASVNSPSRHNCSPLWFATRVLDQAKAGQIVKMLLEAGAMVNVISDKSMMATTPLMNLMRAGHGLTLMSWLLVKGAKVNWPGTYTEGENGGMDATLQGPLITRSADKDAKFIGNKEYIDTLKSHEPPAPKGFLGSAMDALLGYLAAVVSKITTKAVTTSNGDNKNSGTIDHAAFNDDLLQKIADAGLSKYFPPDSPFLQTVVSKAIELAERGDCVLGSPEYLPGLSRLSLYQPILFCDNSGSMNTRERIDSMIEIVGKITSICTLLLPDDEGVQIRFLNGGSKEKALYERYGTVRRASDAEKMINDADYSGVTKLGTILRSDVLCPFVYDVLDGKNGGNGEGGLKRPLLISIITDGCPYKEEPDQLAKTIAECKSILRQRDIDPDAVKFQVTQIGDDKSAEDFLGQLANDPAVKDDIYITRGKIDEEVKKREADEDEMDVWLLKTLTGPILVEEN